MAALFASSATFRWMTWRLLHPEDLYFLAFDRPMDGYAPGLNSPNWDWLGECSGQLFQVSHIRGDHCRPGLGGGQDDVSVYHIGRLRSGEQAANLFSLLRFEGDDLTAS